MGRSSGLERELRGHLVVVGGALGHSIRIDWVSARPEGHRYRRQLNMVNGGILVNDPQGFYTFEENYVIQPHFRFGGTACQAVPSSRYMHPQSRGHFYPTRITFKSTALAVLAGSSRFWRRSSHVGQD